MSEQKMVMVRVRRAHDGHAKNDVFPMAADVAKMQVGFGWVKVIGDVADGSGLQGGRELEAKLRQLMDPKAADRLGNAALRKGAQHLEAAIRQRAPVGNEPTKRRFRTKGGRSYSKDYGRITTNIKVTKTRARIAVSDVQYDITRGGAFWAKMVEFGTVKMAAKPFIRPAVDAEQAAVMKIIGDTLEAGIRRTFKRRGISID